MAIPRKSASSCAFKGIVMSQMSEKTCGKVWRSYRQFFNIYTSIHTTFSRQEMKQGDSYKQFKSVK